MAALPRQAARAMTTFVGPFADSVVDADSDEAVDGDGVADRDGFFNVPLSVPDGDDGTYDQPASVARPVVVTARVEPEPSMDDSFATAHDISVSSGATGISSEMSELRLRLERLRDVDTVYPEEDPSQVSIDMDLGPLLTGSDPLAHVGPDFSDGSFDPELTESESVV